MLVKGLKHPGRLTINFTPSKKQLELWNLLQPNYCPHCGGEIEIKLSSYDQKGLPVYAPICKKCGSDELPQIILGGGAGGGGKAETLNSLIATPFGMRQFGDLKVGDIVSDPITGGQQRIIYLHPIETRDYYRVQFVDGTYVDCSDNHLWQLHVAGKRSKRHNVDGSIDYERVWTAEMMYQWYRKHESGMYKGQNLIIPLCAPIQFTVAGKYHEREIDPYVLGALIGDGCMTDCVTSRGYVLITTMDEEIADQFRSAGYKLHPRKEDRTRAITYEIHDKVLISKLVSLKLSGKGSTDKFIPRDYKYATIEERKALLRGLIDTDGYIDSRGHLTYTSVSQQLAEDVAFIIRSLGGVATITKHHSFYKDEAGIKHECLDHYDVQIRTKFTPELVSITRKKERATYDFNGGTSELGKRIVDVQYIGKREGRCITVDNPRGLYCTNDFTVTHNSYLGSCWIIISCLKYPDLKAVVARKTLKALKGSTFNTIKLVLRTWGLEEGVNYKINNLDGIVTFYNGSTISLIELEDLPSDMEFERLGSNEWSIGFVDECSQISEKAIEVLFSRLRWNISDTFIYPRLLLTTNPCMNWVRSRFVQDEEGNPVKCAKHDAYVQFTVYDNPNKQFVATYRASLDKISDIVTRNRILYGNWDFVDVNKAAAYWNFDGNRHLITGLREKVYDPMKPLILSFDFNVAPYMSCLMIQMDYDSKNMYIIEEMVGSPEDKENNTPKFAEKIRRKLLEMGHLGGIIVTGDPAGMARSTTTEEGVNNYSIIIANLDSPQLRPKKKLLSKQPPQKTRLEFINSIFAGKEEWSIFIDLRCRKLTDDLIHQRMEMDGSKSKAKIMDPKLGIKYEKYGHFSDALDMAVCLFLGDSWKKFNSTGASGITTFSGTPIYGSFDY